MSSSKAGGEKPHVMVLGISGISEEETTHHWVVGPEMFQDCPEPLPVKGPFEVEGNVRKAGETIFFTARATGVLDQVCSRCANNYDEKIDVEAEAVFLPKSADEGGLTGEDEEDGDIETASYSEDVVDLFPPLRDQIALAAPMRPLCREDCKGLCPQCGADLNINECSCRQTSGDPRFSVLKKLLNKEGENAGS